METTEITTVGKLKEAIESLPDGTKILAQVVGEEGGAWNVFAEFATIMPNSDSGRFGLIQVSHPELKRLPDFKGDSGRAVGKQILFDTISALSIDLVFNMPDDTKVKTIRESVRRVLESKGLYEEYLKHIKEKEES